MSVHYSSNTLVARKMVEAGASKIIARAGFNILARSRRVHGYTVRTGTLKNSGFVQAQPKLVTIGYSANYAYFVEGGTRKMKPRPYLRPAFDYYRPKVVAELQAMVAAL